MPNPRTPAPSRIGKTLGAILSNPRRGASDVAAAEDVAAPDEQPNGPGGDAPQPETAAQPIAVAAAPAGAASHPRAAEPTTAARPRAAEPPPTAAPITISVATASTRPADDVEAAEVPDVSRATRRKKRETFLLPEDLADAMRNAIVHLSGPPLYYTLAEFGEHAIRSYIAQLEREHNGARPFPPRPRAVRQGRPLR